MLAGGFDVSIQGVDDAGNIAGRFAAEVGVCGPTQVFLCGFYGTPGQTGEDLTIIGQAPSGFALVPDDVDLYDGVNSVVLGHAEVAYTWTPPGVRAQDFVLVQDAFGVRRIKSGMIAGTVGDQETDEGITAAYWADPAAAPTVIGTLGGAISEAESINSLGWVVGQSETADGQFHAFVWTPGTGMVDLGTLGGSTSGATDINDAGQIVGTAENADGEGVAVMWEPDLSPGGGDPVEISVTESIAVADGVTVAGPVSIFVAEEIQVSDAIAVGGPVEISVSERIDVRDDVRVLGPVSISVVERIDVIDDAGVTPPLLIHVGEQIDVTDAAAVKPPLLISVHEGVAVSDDVMVRGPVTILVIEDVGVSDAVTAEADTADDGDGIEDAIDGAIEGGAFESEAGVFSSRFTDEHLGGTTFGTVLDRGGLEVTVADAASATDGVSAAIAGGAGEAEFAFCPENWLWSFAPGTAFTMTCGSIIVTVHTGEGTLFLENGELRIPAGATVTVTEDGGTTTVENDPHSTANALLVVGGVQVPVAPGDGVLLAFGCLGDVNGDGAVSIADVTRVLRAMFTKPGHRRWNEAADVNNSGRVDSNDLTIVIRSLLDPACRGEPKHCAGDVNGDGHVDGIDALLVLFAIGSEPGRARWNPDADLNADGRISMRDLQIVLRTLRDSRCS
jgi:probable HAF family extracellular repeat protein